MKKKRPKVKGPKVKPAKVKPPSERENRAVPATDASYDPNDIRYIATHEAGHAVASVVLGLNLISTDIKRRPVQGGTSLGYTRCPHLIERQSGEKVIPALIQTFAGPLAEIAVNPDAYGSGADRMDRAEALQAAKIAVCIPTQRPDGNWEISPAEQARSSPEIDALILKGLEGAACIVNDHAFAIVAVADALLRKISLTGDEVAAIVQANPPQPIRV